MDSGKQTEGFRGKWGGDWERPVMGIREGMYCMVHWVLYANNESWSTTSKTKDVEYCPQIAGDSQPAGTEVRQMTNISDPH